MLVLVAAFMFGMSRTVTASPPVPPPAEGFGISVATNVDVIGSLTEHEDFVWTYVSDQLNAADRAAWLAGGPLGVLPLSSVQPLFLAPAGRAAQIRYSDDVDSSFGALNMLDKNFDAGSANSLEGDNNLVVDKDYAYVAGTNPLANAEGHEKGALSIVANGDDQGLGDMPSICPWAAGFGIPATNEFIVAGSSFSTMVAMRTFTDTAVRSTAAPALSHKITADGQGMVRGDMIVRLMEGNRPAIFDDGTGRFWDPLAPVGGPIPNLQGDPNEAGLPEMASIVNYKDTTVASGNILNFKKSMSYKSTIPAYQMPEPWYSIP